MGRTSQFASGAAFIIDHQTVTRNGGRQIDWANVAERYRATPGQTVSTTGAAAGATALPVTALTVSIPSGTTLNFLPGTGKFAKLTATAAIGATSLAVEALPTTIASGDTAIYAGTGTKVLKAGTVVGDALGSGKVSPRVVTTNPAIGILETDAIENSLSAASSGYGIVIGGAVYENLLPESTGSPKVLATAVKTELQTDGVTMGFAFLQYVDTR